MWRKMQREKYKVKEERYEENVERERRKKKGK